MLFLALYLCVFFVHAETFDSSACPSSFRDVDTNLPVDITTCNETPCITKCCAANQVIFSYECVNISNLTHMTNVTDIDDFSGITIYERNIEQNIMKSSKTMVDFTRIYSSDFLECSIDSTWVVNPPMHQSYILEDGRLVVRRIHRRNQWKFSLDIGTFCVEKKLTLNKDGTSNVTVTITTRMAFQSMDESELINISNHTVTACAMLVSSFFLLLVLVVYALLPRTLASLTLMAYVTTLTVGFVFRAAMVFGQDYQQLSLMSCRAIGLIMYYGLIGSFTWLNVMSFDIWSSMSPRQSPQRSTLAKFGWYCAYGWGVPLALLIFMVVVDHLDITHLPDFVKPHMFKGFSCYMEEEERQLYMNGPILTATCINIALFSMTAYDIWRIRTGVQNLRESRRNKVRFGIYIKLSLVMGIFWILEVLSSHILTGSRWWIIPDMLNSSIGLFVFVIFVCKRSILVQLCKRFSIDNDFVQTQIRKLQPDEDPTTTNDGGLEIDTI